MMNQAHAMGYAVAIPNRDASGDRVRGIATTVIVLLATRGILPLVFRLFWMVMPKRQVRDLAAEATTIRSVFLGLETLLTIVAIIFFFVWLYRVVAMLIARGDRPRYSPGMAVGCWFIPFANFVMPPMAIADAWRRVLRTGAGVVGGFWALYLVNMVLQVFLTNPELQRGIVHSRETAMAFSWLGTLVCMGTYASWIVIVKKISDGSRM